MANSAGCNLRASGNAFTSDVRDVKYLWDTFFFVFCMPLHLYLHRRDTFLRACQYRREAQICGGWVKDLERKKM